MRTQNVKKGARVWSLSDCIFQLIWDRQRLSKQALLHSACLKPCQHSSTLFLDFWRCINIAGCIKAEWITFPVKAVGVMGCRRWVWRRRTSQRDSRSVRESSDWEEAARFSFSAVCFVYLTFCALRILFLLRVEFCSALSILDPARYRETYFRILMTAKFAALTFRSSR